jgi:hypothetical protein
MVDKRKLVLAACFALMVAMLIGPVWLAVQIGKAGLP